MVLSILFFESESVLEEKDEGFDAFRDAFEWLWEECPKKSKFRSDFLISVREYRDNRLCPIETSRRSREIEFSAICREADLAVINIVRSTY